MSYLKRNKLNLVEFNNSFRILEYGDEVTISNGGILDPISGDYHSINFNDLDLADAKGDTFICIEKELPNLRCSGLKILTKEQAAEQQQTDSLCEFVKINNSLINNDIIYTNESAGFYDYFGAYIEPDMGQGDPFESQQYIRYTSGTIIDGDGNYHSTTEEGKKSSIIKFPKEFRSSAIFGFGAVSNGETPTGDFRSPEDSLDSFLPVAYIDILGKTVTRLIKGGETVNFDFGEPDNELF